MACSAKISETAVRCWRVIQMMVNEIMSAPIQTIYCSLISWQLYLIYWRYFYTKTSLIYSTFNNTLAQKNENIFYN
jgi:hypothetical protein